MGIDSEPYVSLECIWIIFKKNLSANESPKINLRVLRIRIPHPQLPLVKFTRQKNIGSLIRNAYFSEAQIRLAWTNGQTNFNDFFRPILTDITLSFRKGNI
jgi:hypothetical protein